MCGPAHYIGVAQTSCATTCGLVVVTHDIAGAITRQSAAAAIGSAKTDYDAGSTALFVVDNGVDTAIYVFHSQNYNARVGAQELQLYGYLDGAAQTTLGDYYFR